jgi:hypothetical protein
MLERCCTEREQAEHRGEFCYIAYFDGWCFTDGPRRRMSDLAVSNAAVRGMERHDGEPFVYSCCPFCGADLPKPEEDIQADGGLWR